MSTNRLHPTRVAPPKASLETGTGSPAAPLSASVSAPPKNRDDGFRQLFPTFHNSDFRDALGPRPSLQKKFKWFWTRATTTGARLAYATRRNFHGLHFLNELRSSGNSTPPSHLRHISSISPSRQLYQSNCILTNWKSCLPLLWEREHECSRRQVRIPLLLTSAAVR